MLRRRNKQAGDTIIEVMMVLAVLGLAISISYATANKSLIAARSAQENSQATALLQGQLESMRTLASADPTDIDHNIFRAAGSQFCIDTSVAGQPQVKTAGCSVDMGGYNVDLKITVVAPSPVDTFSLVATWPDVQGYGTASSTIEYRLHRVSGWGGL